MSKSLDFKNLLSEYSEYSDFCAAIKKGKTPVSVAGLVQSAMPQFIYQTTEKRAIVITYNDNEAKHLSEEFEFYTDSVHLFPAKEYVYFNVDAKEMSDEQMRLSAIYNFQNAGGILVAPLEAVLQFTLPKETLEKYTLEFLVGMEYDTEELLETFVKMGYSRVDEVSGKGQFALRGGILDIFSPQNDAPVRIEFFDTEVDSVREFDRMSQRSIDVIDKAVVIPCRELSDYSKEELLEKLFEELKKQKRKKKQDEKLLENLERDIEVLKNGEDLSSICRYINLIFDKTYILIFIQYAKTAKMPTFRKQKFFWEISEKLLTNDALCCIICNSTVNTKERRKRYVSARFQRPPTDL